jgi:hypothetical protein
MDPLFSAGFALLQFGGAATVVGGLGYAIWERRKTTAQRMAEPWRLGAEPLGFKVDAGGSFTSRWVRLAGRHDGRAASGHFHIAGNLAYIDGVQAGDLLAVYTASQQAYGMTRVSVDVGAPLPHGLHVRPESAASETLRYMGVQDVQLGDAGLDSALHVSCDQPDRLRALAATEAGRRALGTMVRNPGLSVYRGQVRCDAEGEHPERLVALLDAASGVAADLEAAVRLGLDGVARELGLSRSGDRVDGGRDGIRFSLVLGPDRGRVVVALPVGAPEGLCIVRAGAPDPGGHAVPLANPILGRLVMVRAAAPEEATAALDERATEAVLAVVRGHEGARVEAGEITLPVEAVHAPAAFLAALEDGLALARSLGREDPEPDRNGP